MRFETRAIHDGQEPDTLTGAVTVPVYQTSTFEQEAIGHHKGFEYSRTGNPTRAALEKALASLEGGEYGLAFASGVAATTAVFSLLKTGDHMLVGDDVYGGTFRLVDKVFKKWGLSATYVDASYPAEVEKQIRGTTKLIWVETPTNPLLKIADLGKLAEIARKKGILLAVDNTFAGPSIQRPLELGADIVVHSTTKYLSGHSDTIGGAVITSRRELYHEIKFYQNAAGAVPGPWDAWLVLRGIKTLAIRVRQHEENALYLARYLARHRGVERVYYPGLVDHPGHAIARRQMDGFGGMISIELAGGFPAVERFAGGLKLFLLAESLGGVESLVCYPPRMTHGALSDEERAVRGIKDNLVRLSVGIEHRDDLKADLARALSKK
jgi:cystathionine gamma-synthase/cystathionine gamma-lyase